MLFILLLQLPPREVQLIISDINQIAYKYLTIPSINCPFKGRRGLKRQLIICISNQSKNNLRLIISKMENQRSMLSLQQQINSYQYSYPDDGIKPCAYFWKELTLGKEAPSLLVPDTLIINIKENPLLWVYTNRQLKVEANANISLKDFVAKVTNFCSPNELVATMKRLVSKNQPNNYGHDVKLVNSRYLHNLSVQQLGDNIITIQKYVKSHGKQAFICRTVYSQATHPYCFLITNKHSFYETEIPENKRFLVTNTHSTRDSNKLTITKTSSGRHLAETLPIMNEIIGFFRFQRGIKLTELVADFIKDEEGNWWLTNVKAFKVQERVRPGLAYSASSSQLKSKANDKQKYQRTKQCKYCQISYLQSQLTHKMTRKMIVEMDRFLLHMGKDYEWLLRSDMNIDCHSFYQEFKICSRCYRLYLEIQALLGFQGQFLRRLSVSTEAQPKDLLMRLTNKQELQAQSKTKEIVNLKNSIPEEISLGPNSSIITRNNCPLRNDETIHQMVRYRFLIYLHELDEMTNIQPHTNYYLDFALFGSKFKIKLDLRPGMTSSLIKKLRLCYFFFPTANELQNLQEYIQKQEVLKIHLLAERRDTGQKRVAGRLGLDLKEFLVQGRKSFYKFLDIEGGFGWGLEGSIGLIRNQKQVNTSRLILSTQDRLVYLPSQHYYICEPLPQEWITQIQNKNRQKPLELTIKSVDCMKGQIQTGDQFIPDQTYYKKEVVEEKKKVDWKDELKKEVRSYERKAFRVIQ